MNRGRGEATAKWRKATQGRNLKQGASRWPCACDIGEAQAWLDDLTEAASDGDDDATRVLPAAQEHLEAVVAREAGRRQRGVGMTTATLAVKDLGGMKRYIIDCPHGTTTAHGADGGGIGEQAMLAAVVMKHHAEEACECTLQLRERYPASLVPRAQGPVTD